jgi:hypothetical protein
VTLDLALKAGVVVSLKPVTAEVKGLLRSQEATAPGRALETGHSIALEIKIERL